MNVLVEIESEGAEHPPRGTPIHVEVRDVGLQDARATVVGSADTTVGSTGRLLAKLAVRVTTLPRHTTIWAHVDVDRDGHVSAGDYITVQSFPVPTGPAPRARISVRRV